MMKLGEAASWLSRLDVLAPAGVEWALAVANRNFIIHQYDQINRELTWLTLSVDLPAWSTSLAPLVDQRRAALDAATGATRSPTPIRSPLSVSSTRESSTRPPVTSHSRMPSLRSATYSRVSATTSAPVAAASSASAAVRDASSLWTTIWPRWTSTSNTASGFSPERMARLSLA